MATAVLVLLAIFGGTSAAAEMSLPGHLLYPIKVNVNEEVRDTLTLSASGKAAYAAARAEERLNEAEEVSIQESVDASVRAQLEANFKAFADSADARIKALESTDAKAAADIASNFEVALRAHEKVLANLGVVRTDVRSETANLHAKVEVEANDAANIRAEAEAKVRAEGNGPDTKTAAQGKLGAAANVIASVRRFIDSKADVMSVDEKAQAEARLATASDLVAQGQAKFAAGAYADAFNLGNAAIRAAQSVHELLDIEGGLESDLQESKPEQSEQPEQTERPEGSLSPSASVHAENELELRLNF